MAKKSGYLILLTGKKKQMNNEKFDRQIKDVPVFSNPRRRKRMWEEHVLNKTLEGGVIAEFGVHQAQSIGWFTTHYPDTAVYGFDSFEGLPENWMVNNKIFFKKGHFSLDGKIPHFAHLDRPTTIFVKGWFEDTLPEWSENLDEYIKIAHIDCDIYSSTVTVLDSIAPHLRPGSFILFDEILTDEGKENEYKAFCEFCESNPNFDFEVIAKTNGVQAMIKVTSI